MGEMLEKESVEAWDDRKRKAKVQGEAATTKLLFPMILMLGVVMAIVMLPACLSLLWINPIRRPIFIFKKKSAKGNFSG